MMRKKNLRCSGEDRTHYGGKGSDESDEDETKGPFHPLEMASNISTLAYSLLEESWLNFVGKQRETKGLSPDMPYVELKPSS
jgi:hypothetical protein